MRRLPLALALAAALAGCPKPEQPRTGTPPPRKARVVTAPALLREIEYKVESNGEIQAAEEIGIPASVSGVVEAVHFKEGDSVDESTVLVEIDVDRYRLGGDRAQAEFDRAKAQSDLAETVYKSRLQLYEEGRKQKKDWVTDEQLATWRVDLEKAKAEQDRAKADLELARRDHRNSRVRPPIKGLINQKRVSKGEFVKPETVVAMILNVGTLHVRFTLTQLEASRLQPGQEIAFEVSSAPGRPFKARLFYMSQKADPGTRSVECKAEVLERSELFRAGYYADVKISTPMRSGIVVPERAVLSTERGFAVFVSREDKAARRPVELGLRVDGMVEILKGLTPGEKVVVDGAAALREGLELEEKPGGGP